MPSPSNRALRAAALTVSAAALLSGCAAVGPNYHAPAPLTQAQVYTQGDEVTPIQAAVGEKVIADWWTLFHSAELDKLVREAIAGNKTLQAAKARLAAARATEGTDTGQLLVDGTVGYTRERINLRAFSGGAFATALPGGQEFPSNPEFDLYSVGLNVGYNLDLFGEVRRRKEAHKADTEAQKRELEAAYLTLTGQVVVQALTAADATFQAKFMTEIVDNDQRDLDMVKRAQAAGGASLADVATIQAQLAADAALIPVQNQRRAVAQHAMAVLIGKSPSDWSPPDFAITENYGVLPTHMPVALPSELVHGRPDIMAAEARLHAATARIGVATAALYPNITLAGGINQGGLYPAQLFDPIATAWTIGPNVTLPIFHQRELTDAKRQAMAEARAALADYEQTVLAAFGQVSDALQDVVHNNEARAKQIEALDAARSRMDMVRKGYAAGGSSALQLVDAERTFQRTRLAFAQQSTSRYGAAALLLLATASVPPEIDRTPETDPKTPFKQP